MVRPTLVATLTGGVVVCFALATTLVAASAQERSAGTPAARAEALFTKQCAGCHTVPSPDLRTDRAWLKQVSDTA